MAYYIVNVEHTDPEDSDNIDDYLTPLQLYTRYPWLQFAVTDRRLVSLRLETDEAVLTILPQPTIGDKNDA